MKKMAEKEGPSSSSDRPCLHLDHRSCSVKQKELNTARKLQFPVRSCKLETPNRYACWIHPCTRGQIQAIVDNSMSSCKLLPMKLSMSARHQLGRSGLGCFIAVIALATVMLEWNRLTRAATRNPRLKSQFHAARHKHFPTHRRKAPEIEDSHPWLRRAKLSARRQGNFCKSYACSETSTWRWILLSGSFGTCLDSITHRRSKNHGGAKSCGEL